MRLDAHAAQLWPELSRSTWRKHIEAGYVTVDGAVVTSPKHDVGEDSTVSSQLPEAKDYTDDTLPVLYEDENVVVIDKPRGVLTHSKGAINEEFTVAEFVRNKTSYKADTNRPGIVHRLDRDTSGIILCVKNDETASYIQKQFSNRTVKKQYVAVLEKAPKEHEAVLKLPIGRNPSAPSTFRVDVNGKPAETYYQVDTVGTNGFTLAMLKPHTGRTHQLRVHMAYLHTPILGDVVYGKKKADRMYLHAQLLEVTLPGGKRTVFESPAPKSFKSVLQ